MYEKFTIDAAVTGSVEKFEGVRLLLSNLIGTKHNVEFSRMIEFPFYLMRCMLCACDMF